MGALPFNSKKKDITHLHGTQFSSPWASKIRTFHSKIQNFAVASGIWKYLPSWKCAMFCTQNTRNISSVQDLLRLQLYFVRPPIKPRKSTHFTLSQISLHCTLGVACLTTYSGSFCGKKLQYKVIRHSVTAWLKQTVSELPSHVTNVVCLLDMSVMSAWTKKNLH